MLKVLEKPGRFTRGTLYMMLNGIHYLKLLKTIAFQVYILLAMDIKEHLTSLGNRNFTHVVKIYKDV